MSTSKPSVVLVNIDNLNDFIQENGKLSVPNAIPAANNTAGFITDNISKIDHIVNIFDTHRKKHIFYPIWWINKQGEHPKDYEKITYQKVFDKTWMPVFEEKWSLLYAKILGEFTIWPEHCTEGTAGSELFPPIEDAIKLHSSFHKTSPTKVIKGLFEKTENYGSFGPEVEDLDDPSTKPNYKLMRHISSFDLSYWCGEERGHCVRRSLEQYISWCQEHAPKAISKMRYLDDCISTLEFGDEYKADVAHSVQGMVDLGMVVVRSTDPIS